MLSFSKSSSVRVGITIVSAVLVYSALFCVRRYLELMLHSGVLDWVLMIGFAILPAAFVKLESRLYRVCVFLVTLLLNVVATVVAMVILFPQFL
jgi:hypothetical protein